VTITAAARVSLPKNRSLIITPVCTELMKDRIEATLNMLTKYRIALR